MEFVKRIILVAGRSGSGKDIFSDILVKNLGYNKYAFADSLKKQVSEKYDIPLELTKTQEGKKTVVFLDREKPPLVTIRSLLITEAAMNRKVNENYYSELLVQEILESNKEPYIVISDFRYPNEYETIIKYFPNVEVLTVKLIRETCNKIEDLSESSLEKFEFDTVIVNNYTTIQELEKDVLTIF